MATDFLAQLTAGIAAPIDVWLAEHGIDQPVELNPPSRKEAGDLVIPCHRYARTFRKAPQAIAEDVGVVAARHEMVLKVEAVSGFLNLYLNWAALAAAAVEWVLTDDGALGQSDALTGQKIVVEYSSPNTNKPQHLGHVRNNILGHTVSTLMEAAGAEVRRVNLINDRGIAICKSMLAYQRFGDGVTPVSSGKKGDHLVGDFYVAFETAFKAEFEASAAEDKAVFFNTESELGAAARQMLLDWEAGDADVRALWQTMNGWCEAGFHETYERLGVRFDTIYRESETYLLGKDLVGQGLASGVFHRAENGAAVFDLKKIGMKGEKAVARADGTSLYTTQDLGTAVKRHEEWAFDEMVYVVGNEQDHHFKVLFGILGELKPELQGRLHHLSYGMVELPDGKMKSREGTVVDADNLIDDLHEAAAVVVRANNTELDEDSVNVLAEAVALGGLKFFVLRFSPKTNFVFDKERSIKPQGETGVYCQYQTTRASAMLRKLAASGGGSTDSPDWSVFEEEMPRALLTALLAYPGHCRIAAVERKPNLVCKAIYDIAKAFSTFYDDDQKRYRILTTSGGRQAALVLLVRATHRVLGGGLNSLGITALDKM